MRYLGLMRDPELHPEPARRVGPGSEAEDQSSTGSESGTGTLEFLPCGASHRLVDPNFLFKPDGFSGTGP